MADILLIVAGFVFLVWLVLLWTYSYWYRRGVPQGNPLKLLGDLNDVMITFTPYWQHYLMLDRWKEIRANFSSLMTPARLRNAFLPEILVVSGQAVDYLKDLTHESGKSDGTNVKNFGLRYMTNILVRVSLSLDAGCFKDDKSPFLYQVEHIFNTGIDSIVAALLLFVAPGLGTIFGYSFLTKDVQNFFNHYVREQKRYRNENEITRNDILDWTLRKASEIKTQKHSRDTMEISVDPDFEALSLIIVFFLEGFETSATTISSTMASLAKYEDIQENLRCEILKVCPRGKEITEEALNSISLLQNCIFESLRLFPPGFLMQRVVTENVTLQSKTGEQLDLKKGEYIYIPLAALQRDPENFPDPEKFDLPDSRTKTKNEVFIVLVTAHANALGKSLLIWL